MRKCIGNNIWRQNRREDGGGICGNRVEMEVVDFHVINDDINENFGGAGIMETDEATQNGKDDDNSGNTRI